MRGTEVELHNNLRLIFRVTVNCLQPKIFIKKICYKSLRNLIIIYVVSKFTFIINQLDIYEIKNRYLRTLLYIIILRI